MALIRKLLTFDLKLLETFYVTGNCDIEMKLLCTYNTLYLLFKNVFSVTQFSNHDFIRLSAGLQEASL